MPDFVDTLAQLSTMRSDCADLLRKSANLCSSWCSFGCSLHFHRHSASLRDGMMPAISGADHSFCAPDGAACVSSVLASLTMSHHSLRCESALSRESATSCGCFLRDKPVQGDHCSVSRACSACDISTIQKLTIVSVTSRGRFLSDLQFASLNSCFSSVFQGVVLVSSDVPACWGSLFCAMYPHWSSQKCGLSSMHLFDNYLCQEALLYTPIEQYVFKNLTEVSLQHQQQGSCNSIGQDSLAANELPPDPIRVCRSQDDNSCMSTLILHRIEYPQCTVDNEQSKSERGMHREQP